MGGMRFSAALLAACGAYVPPPEQAFAEYSEALRHGDVDTVYEMLSDAEKKTVSREQVRDIMADAQKELAEQAQVISTRSPTSRTEARLRFSDGEASVLLLENHRFVVASADALPFFADTPEQALVDLRKVIARRSYAGLLRVLSESTRNAIETDLKVLVEALREPASLDVRVKGDIASVNLAGGHQVRLRKEQGSWRVVDFD